MEKQTISVCFVLDPSQSCAGRERDMRLVRTEFQEEEIPFTIVEESPEDGIVAELSFSNEAESGTEVLYAADSDRLFQMLKKRKLPVVGYRHEGNECQKLEKAAWILAEPQYIDRDSYEKIWQRLAGKPWLIAETDRLVIREMTEGDLDGLYRLYDDPETVRFLEPLSPDREKEKNVLQAYIRKVYGLYGYGMWAVCERKTGELIGRVGFEPYQGNSRPVELGYLIRADCRRRGFAAEAARAALQFADENLDFPATAVRTDAGNTASIHLAQILGFVKATPPEEKEGITVDAEKNRGIRYFIRENPEHRTP